VYILLEYGNTIMYTNNETYQLWLNERPNYKSLKDWNPRLPELILKAHPSKDNRNTGHINRIVTGTAGVGKSIYAYKIMAKTDYILNGYTKVDQEENSYKFALDNIIYRPRELFERIQKQRNIDEPALVWCLDDASVHFGRQLFDQDRNLYRQLQGAVPTLREDVTGLLLTTIIVDLLAKPLREFVRKKIHIMPLAELSSHRCIARHYEKWYFPDDIRFRIHVPFQERFSSLCPEPFYGWYHKKKMDALNEYLSEILVHPVKPSGGESSESDSGL
jgi:hypothetical protein